MEHVLLIETTMDNKRQASVTLATRQPALAFVFMASTPGARGLHRRTEPERMNPVSLADQLHHWQQCTADDTDAVEGITSVISGKCNEMLVVFLGVPQKGQPGIITCMASLSVSGDNDICMLRSLIVNPTLRRKGMGTVHVYTLERVIPLGFPEVKFILLTSLPTVVGFWTKCGFVENDPAMDAYTSPEQRALMHTSVHLYGNGCRVLTKVISPPSK